MPVTSVSGEQAWHTKHAGLGPASHQSKVTSGQMSWACLQTAQRPSSTGPLVIAAFPSP